MRKIYLSVVLAVLLAVGVVYGTEIPRPNGPVNDFAHVIPQTYIDKLNKLIIELEQKTSVEIVVATFSSIAPYDEKQFARMVYDSWKPGKKGKDNGVLVLIAVNQRRWRIETGYGLEGILPDGLCGDIGRNYIVPYFKKGDYGAGIYNGVAAIADVIVRDAKIKIEGLGELPAAKNGSDEVSALLFLIGILLFFGFNIFVLVYRSRHGQGIYRGTGIPPSGGSGGWGGGFGGGGFGGGGFGGGGGGGGGAGGGW